MFIFPIQLYANELNDIEKQINETKSLQQQKQNDLIAAQHLLTSLQNSSELVTTNISDLKNQIQDLKIKINLVNNQVNELVNNIDSTQKLIDSEKSFRDSQIRQYFMDTYVSDQTSGLELMQGANLDFVQTSHVVKSYAIKVKKDKLDTILAQYNVLTTQKTQILSLKQQLNDENNNLDKKQKQLQEYLLKISNNIGSTSSQTQTLKSQLSSINSNLSFLDARHSQLLEQELQKMATQQQTQQTVIQSGQFFFLGRGRDLIDGHGMGMSQWGAYGEALNYGWTYDQIVKFYYPSASLGDYKEPDKIVVDGKTNVPISFESYLAGIGEVPNDWPSEAIKAQIVAARTYAMAAAYKGSDGYFHICGSDQCQVYVGGTAKLSYVQATKGKVLLYNSLPITAYFTASIRGCSSTLGTVWGSTNQPYIQTVKDDSYAYKDYTSPNPYDPSGSYIKPYNWQWRTNGYSLNQLSDILSGSISTNVGKLQSISTTKDICGRVAKIVLVGDLGTKTLSGWDFRAIFNNITPFNDYVYSTEFSFEQK